MSAQTRQQTLDGDLVDRSKAPRDGRSAALWRLPADTTFPEVSVWALRAHDGDAEQVLRWLDRAREEGAIVRVGDR